MLEKLENSMNRADNRLLHVSVIISTDGVNQTTITRQPRWFHQLEVACSEFTDLADYVQNGKTFKTKIDVLTAHANPTRRV